MRTIIDSGGRLLATILLVNFIIGLAMAIGANDPAGWGFVVIGSPGFLYYVLAFHAGYRDGRSGETDGLPDDPPSRPPELTAE